MKGTVFSSDREFPANLLIASKSNLNWILQEEVTNAPQSFSWYEQNGQPEPIFQTSDDWYMRVTAHYVSSQLADIVVTARRDKAVHGAKDCLQLGAVIV